MVVLQELRTVIWPDFAAGLKRWTHKLTCRKVMDPAKLPFTNRQLARIVRNGALDGASVLPAARVNIKVSCLTLIQPLPLHAGMCGRHETVWLP